MFLLTLTSNNAKARWEFLLPIRYEEFLVQIRVLLGQYVAGADKRYLTFMLDFLNTLDNLQGGEVMNPEFVDFLADRFGEVQRFHSEIRAFKRELRNKVERLAECIKFDAALVNQGTWGEGDGLRYVLFHYINLDQDSVIAVDTVINPKGWEIQIFMQDPNERERLGRLLHTLKIPFETSQRFVHRPFKYATDLEQIAPIVEEVVRKLANSGDAWRANG